MVSLSIKNKVIYSMHHFLFIYTWNVRFCMCVVSLRSAGGITVAWRYSVYHLVWWVLYRTKEGTFSLFNILEKKL